MLCQPRLGLFHGEGTRGLQMMMVRGGGDSHEANEMLMKGRGDRRGGGSLCGASKVVTPTRGPGQEPGVPGRIRTRDPLLRRRGLHCAIEARSMKKRAIEGYVGRPYAGNVGQIYVKKGDHQSTAVGKQLFQAGNPMERSVFEEATPA